jgi:hypothetical protein
MSKNVVGSERQQTIWRMRVACWISKPTRTHAHAQTHAPRHAHTRSRTHIEIYNTYCFSMATMVTHTRFSVTLCVHCLSCFKESRCIITLNNRLPDMRSTAMTNECDIRNSKFYILNFDFKVSLLGEALRVLW